MSASRNIFFGVQGVVHPSGARFSFVSRFKQCLVSVLSTIWGPRNDPRSGPIFRPKECKVWAYFWAPEMAPFFGPRNGALKSVPIKRQEGPETGPQKFIQIWLQKADPKNQKMPKLGPQNRHTNGPQKWTPKRTPKTDPNIYSKNGPQKWTPKLYPKLDSKMYEQKWTPNIDLRNGPKKWTYEIANK